jgi:hypothetical protein
MGKLHDITLDLKYSNFIVEYLGKSKLYSKMSPWIRVPGGIV